LRAEAHARESERHRKLTPSCPHSPHPHHPTTAAAAGVDAQAAAARAAPVAAAAAAPVAEEEPVAAAPAAAAAAAPVAAAPAAAEEEPAAPVALSDQDAMLANIDAAYAKRLGIAPPAPPAAPARAAPAAAAEEEEPAAAPAAARAAPAAAAEEEPAAAAAADPTAAAEEDPLLAAPEDEFVAGKNLIVVMTLPGEQQNTAYRNQALLRKTVAEQAGVPVDSVLFYNQTSMADPRTGQQTLSISMNVECGNEAACKNAGKRLYPPSSAAALGSKITKASGVQPIPGTIQTFGVNNLQPASRGKATLEPIRLAVPRAAAAAPRAGGLAGFGALPAAGGGDPLAMPAGVLPGSALASMLPAGATQLGTGMGMGTGTGLGMGTGMGAGMGLDGDSARLGPGQGMMPPAGVGSNSLLAPLPNNTATAAAPLTSRRASVASGAASTAAAGVATAAAAIAALVVAF